MAGKAYLLQSPTKIVMVNVFLAIGPILPQLPVIGKELGISADIMGLITSVLPILYILAKPAVGYLMDYFTVNGTVVD